MNEFLSYWGICLLLSPFLCRKMVKFLGPIDPISFFLCLAFSFVLNPFFLLFIIFKSEKIPLFTNIINWINNE